MSRTSVELRRPLRTDLDDPVRLEAASSSGTAIPGVTVIPDRRFRLQRRLTLAVTIIPFVGLVAAIATLWGRGIHPTDLSIMFGFYMFTGLGVTIGFHRLFTHQSFEAPGWFRGLLAIAGSMAIQGPVIKWVADHRRHHAYSDHEGDPHSPHLEAANGVAGILRGLWHAHIGWFFDKEQTSAKRWAPDLVKEPRMRTIDRLFPLWGVLSFALPALLGLVLTRSWQGAVTAFLWGSLVRIFMLHHVTWSINSICHYYGERPFETPDMSTNNWVLSIISFGESWHNNHHAFPTSAVHGVGRAQFDMTGALIKVLEKLGLAWNVKVVTDKQLAAKAVPGL
ncbi:MAG: acyl-CoA desaturase [Actinomycetota bacterium]|nr:acyl-CoA desaturase [Actinomycetota bacterium]